MFKLNWVIFTNLWKIVNIFLSKIIAINFGPIGILSNRFWSFTYTTNIWYPFIYVFLVMLHYISLCMWDFFFQPYYHEPISNVSTYVWTVYLKSLMIKAFFSKNPTRKLSTHRSKKMLENRLIRIKDNLCWDQSHLSKHFHHFEFLKLFSGGENSPKL